MVGAEDALRFSVEVLDRDVELREGHGPPRSEGVVGRQGRDSRFREDRLGVEAPPIIGGIDESGIDLASTDEIRVLSPGAQLHRDRFGAGLGRRRRQNAIQKSAVGVRLHRQEDAPGSGCGPSGASGGGVQSLQRRSDVGEESRSRLGQGDGSSGAAEELDAEFGLESPDCARQSGRGDPQLLRRAREAPVVGDRGEVAQRSRLDGHGTKSRAHTFMPLVLRRHEWVPNGTFCSTAEIDSLEMARRSRHGRIGMEEQRVNGIGIENYGERPHLIDVPLPEPGAGEIEVELHAASLNPLDDAVAAGYLAGVGEFRLPLILGFDGAGIVRRLGSGVTGLDVGDRVFGQFWSAPMQFGAFAETALVQARPALGALRRIPDGVGFEHAAASPTAAMTAAGALDRSGATRGDAILILGATGGVGTFAVQEAKARGMRVVAVARSDAADALRDLGVDDVLDRDGGVTNAIAELGPAAVAAVLDFAGVSVSVDIAAGAVRDGGAVVSTAYGVSDTLRSQGRIAAMDYVLDDKPARLDRLADALITGTVRPMITRVIGLEDAARGVATSDIGLRGKTVIRLQ